MFLSIVKKLLSGLGVLIFVIIIVTSVVYLTPVDAERLSFGQRSDSETVESLKQHYGLDKSLRVQLWRYLGDLSPIQVLNQEKRGNSWEEDYKSITLYKSKSKVLLLKWPYLRRSYQNGRRVSDILKEDIPKTAALALAAMILALALGISLGALSAHFPNSLMDKMIVSISVFGYSLPSYVTSIILAIIFGFVLHNLTGLNIQGSLIELNDVGEPELRLKNLILPAIALGIRPVAVITQLSRAAFLDVISATYVTTAKAKGLPYKTIFTKHVMPNGLNPVITASSGWLASMLTGAFFVETVFNYKGLGFTTVSALINFDIPLILACVIFTSIIFVLTNILVDILYYAIDPKIRLELVTN